MHDDQNIGALITEHQQRLYGYIHSLTGDRAASWDILQETNLVIWRKRAEFESIANFASWALTIARFQVLAHLRDRSREPLSVLSQDLMEVFGDEPEALNEQWDDRLHALRRCRRKLPERSQLLLNLFYDRGLLIPEIAERMQMKPNAIKQAIFRVRRILADCIETQTAEPTA